MITEVNASKFYINLLSIKFIEHYNLWDIYELMIKEQFKIQISETKL